MEYEREIRNEYKILVGKPPRLETSWETCLKHEGNIIQKATLKGCCVRIGAGSEWFRKVQ
jgi:hypothetical protein